MYHLLKAGKFLGVEELALKQSLTRYQAGSAPPQREVTKKETIFIASAEINNYTDYELRWLGIATAQGKDGLVAVVFLRGDMQRYSDYYCNGTEEIARQIDICNGNPLVNAILFVVDSGGGEVASTDVLVQAIKTSEKPIIGFGIERVASAALECFAHCDECYIESNMTCLGSIGVMLVLCDQSAHNEQEGLKYLVIRASGAEDKAPLNPWESFDSPAAQAEIQQRQGICNQMRAEMLAKIMKARPQMSADPGAKIFYGKDAIKIGLADGITSFANALKRADVLGIQYKKSA